MKKVSQKSVSLKSVGKVRVIRYMIHPSGPVKITRASINSLKGVFINSFGGVFIRGLTSIARIKLLYIC